MSNADKNLSYSNRSCRDNLKLEYELYLEYLLRKVRRRLPYLQNLQKKVGISYIAFALLFVISPNFIQFILLSDIGKTDLITNLGLKGNIGILWAFSLFFMIVMARRLRDISVEVFLDDDLPYPRKIKDNMQNYLYIIFSPYKRPKHKKTPKFLEKRDKLTWLWFNHRMLLIAIISFIAGLLGFWWLYDEALTKAAKGIITSGDVVVSATTTAIFGCAGMWIFVSLLVYIIISLILLLRLISEEVGCVNYSPSIDLLKRSGKLRKIYVNILYAYASMIIATPSVIIASQSDHGYWNLFNLIYPIIGPVGFLIALAWPGIYIHKIINISKDNFMKQTAHKLRQLENDIYGEQNNDKYAEKCCAYESLINVIDGVEKIRTWPVDFSNIIKIIVAGIVSSIPTIMQYGLVHIS